MRKDERNDHRDRDAQMSDACVAHRHRRVSKQACVIERCVHGFVGAVAADSVASHGRPVDPEQQYLAVTVELCERFRLDQRKSVRRIALDLRDAGHRIAGRKYAVESGRHEQIADFDVRLHRHERQVELAEIARADRNGADAVAIDLDGNGVLGVADQDDERGVLVDLRHLAHDAERIENGLTQEHTVVDALVDAHPVSKRINVDVHDLRDQRARCDAFGGLANCTQTPIFLVQGLELQQLHARAAQVLGQLRILGAQAVSIAEAVRQPVPGLERRVHDDVERICGGAHPQARNVEIAAAMVKHHHHDREHAEKEQTRAEGRASADDRSAV